MTKWGHGLSWWVSKCSLTHSLTHSLPHSLTPSLNSLPHALTPSPTHLPIQSLTHLLTHSPNHPLIQSPFTCSPTHSLSHSPTYPPTYSLTHSLAHSLAHSLLTHSNLIHMFVCTHIHLYNSMYEHMYIPLRKTPKRRRQLARFTQTLRKGLLWPRFVIFLSPDFV